MRFADPERLVGKKRRNELAAAETSLCYLTRGKFGEDQNDDGFIDTRWVELEELYDNCGKQNLNRALKAYRTAEKKAADEAIVGFEERMTNRRRHNRVVSALSGWLSRIAYKGCLLPCPPVPSLAVSCGSQRLRRAQWPVF